MKRRRLGKTDIETSVVSFGASSLGQEFGQIDIDTALRCIRVAIDLGMNFIDTSPYYGRGMSEMLLGRVLPDFPRDSFFLGTKLGRYTPTRFDYSPRRVAESIEVSLERMKVDYLDIVLCHDIEFADPDYILNETIPAMREQVAKGKVRYIGVSGYPIKMLLKSITEADIDVVLTYNHYTLQNDMATTLIPACELHGVGLINAAPFAARLLTDVPLPAWHKATPAVRQAAKLAAKYCRDHGSDIAKLALQYSVSNIDMPTCVAGSANPERLRSWATWVSQPMDQELLAAVQDILRPVHNWFHIEGRPENNDTPVSLAGTKAY